VPGWARTVAPGEESQIEVKFNTKGKRNRQTKRITVRTDDPNNERFVFTLTGNIFEPISIAPPSLSIRSKLGESVTKSIKITNNLDHPLTLGQIEYPDEDSRERVEFRLDKNIIQPNDFAEFTVISNGKKEGRLYKTFTVPTDEPKYKTLSIRVNVFVEGGKIEFPTALSFGRFLIGEEKTQTVQITNNMDHPVSFGEITFPDEKIRSVTTGNLDKKSLAVGESASLSVTLNPKETGALKGVLTIHTDDDKMPLISIRMNAQIDPAVGPNANSKTNSDR